jgi:hypothetical protein
LGDIEWCGGRSHFLKSAVEWMVCFLTLLQLFVSTLITQPFLVSSIDHSLSSPFPIDVVLTWVQQPSPSQYQTIQRYCSDKKTGSNIQRFRDTGTLYYSIKSILKYLPWIRKIFLVLNDVDSICWLDFTTKENQKIILIRHFEIWPPDQSSNELPTFNSIAIESHLHRIKDLSESFLYFNDDMFVGRDLLPSDFFNLQTGVPHVWVKDLFWLPYELLEEENFIWHRDPHYSLNMSNGSTSILSTFYYPHDPITPRPFPGAYMGTHGPYICTKSLISLIQSLWPQYFHHLSSQRCRTSSNTQPSSTFDQNSSDDFHHFIPPYRPPFWIYQWYLLVSNISLPIEREVPFLNMFHIPSEFHHKILSSSSIKPIDFFILNDDYSTQTFKIDLEIKYQQIFLEKYFDFDSLNNFWQSQNEKKIKVVDFRNCSLVKDQSYLSITQRRNFFQQEKAKFFEIIHSENISQSRLQWRFREIVESYREYDEWLSPTVTTVTDAATMVSSVTHRRSAENVNRTHHLAVNNLILSSPVEVGHYSDLRETSLSGPLSFEGIESLSFREKEIGEHSVVIPFMIYNGNGEAWGVSCDTLTQLIQTHKQFHEAQAGIIILVKGIAGGHSGHRHANTSSLFELAQCLQLNYIRGNTNRGRNVSDDWGVLSSYVLRDIRRYDLFLRDTTDQMMRSTIPVLVTSIPISIPSSLSVRNEGQSSPKNHSTYRNTLWFDLWYLFGDERFLINSKQRKLFLQEKGSRSLELLEMIKLRQMKRFNDTIHYGSPLASLFVGLVRQRRVTNPRTQHLWKTLQTVFKRNHKPDQYFQSVGLSNCSQHSVEEDLLLMSIERHPSPRKNRDRLVVTSQQNCHERRTNSHVSRLELYR